MSNSDVLSVSLDARDMNPSNDGKRNGAFAQKGNGTLTVEVDEEENSIIFSNSMTVRINGQEEIAEKIVIVSPPVKCLDVWKKQESVNGETYILITGGEARWDEQTHGILYITEPEDVSPSSKLDGNEATIVVSVGYESDRSADPSVGTAEPGDPQTTPEPVATPVIDEPASEPTPEPTSEPTPEPIEMPTSEPAETPEIVVTPAPVENYEKIVCQVSGGRLRLNWRMTVHLPGNREIVTDAIEIDPVPADWGNKDSLLDNETIVISGGALSFKDDGTLLISKPKSVSIVSADSTHAEHVGVCVQYDGGYDSGGVSTGWLIGCGGLILALAAALAVTLLKRRKKKDKGKADAANTGTPSLSYSALRNIGSRENQQDNYGVCAVKGGVFAVVADGMGGLKNGDIVSQKIAQTAIADGKSLSPEELRGNLLRIVSHVNSEVNRMLGRMDTYKSGSTMITLYAEQTQFSWASVGDSRIYLYRSGKLLQLNREHNYEAELLLRAVNQEISFQDARTHQKKKSVSSFIGMGTLKHVDEMQRPVKAIQGDIVLMCTDGVYNTLPDAAIESILSSDCSLKEMTDRLEAAVLQRKNPHQDNFTAVLVKYE